MRRRKCSSSKKGSVFDAMFLIIFLFATALFIIMMWPLYKQYNVQVQASSMPSEGKAIVQNYATKYVALWDYGFLTLYIGLTLVAALSARMIDTFPWLFGVSLFILVFIVLLAAVLSNAWDSIASSPGLSSYISDFTIIPYFMHDWALFGMISAAIVITALYAKPGGGL